MWGNCINENCGKIESLLLFPVYFCFKSEIKSSWTCCIWRRGRIWIWKQSRIGSTKTGKNITFETIRCSGKMEMARIYIPRELEKKFEIISLHASTILLWWEISANIQVFEQRNSCVQIWFDRKNSTCLNKDKGSRLV